MKSSSRQEAVNRTAPSLRREEDRTETTTGPTFMTVVLFDQHRAGEPDQARVVGEDADDVGAAADLAVDALERVRAAQLGPVLAREGVEAEQVALGIEQQLGDLRRDRLQALDDLSEPLARLLARGGGEDAADRGGDHRLLAFGAVAEHVAQEVHAAALPRAAEYLADRGLQALVAV
jgi:hypothetical protein